ncbi:lipoprotein insertase outer membrane protein LolB [Stenotrophomonas mori]|uniref:Outer-membrane lipoprotein LolB n=1 Tax=Stenotrophomonas mori TaxID=2871096 RepID=A0ABT0SIP6_9GAMM|nr:lipoprotein insertase outer membrane protein LolB [Stenotrophomonas mori]MCL7715202.1 lipoprotein insertase outer membrane protein LolB [Stenotrophomonas mori]
MAWPRAVLGGLAILALGGCGTLAPRQPPPVAVHTTDLPAAEAARRALLDARPDWSFQGRVAISKGRSGGSGRIDWQQRQDGYEVALAAPVTRQGWTLSGGAGQAARLEGLEGGPRSGGDAAQLLLQATGWEIPVEGLAAWVRGRPAAQTGGPDYQGYDAEGLPRVLQQGGWRIDYLAWYPADAGQPALPRRIEAANGDAKVRLIVDEWHLDGP